MALFEKLPDKIFRPLAAASRYFYAALLMHLYEHSFDSVGDTPRRSDLINEIGDFIDRCRSAGTSFDEADDGNEEARRLALREAKGQDARRYTAYYVLVESGWLVELRDRYRKLVDLSPEGRLLLQELHRIASGDTRSYGGIVLNVLGNLNESIAHPDERSENIRNAWRFSRDFVQHLRTLSGEMRRVEEKILSEDGTANFFRAFFADYVSQSLIADYKTLHTKNNPFRFRGDILERVRQIEGDPLLALHLARGYVREGRAETEPQADETIRRELAEIYRVFDNIDRHLDVIDETQSRIERRVYTVIRYMDRDDGGLLDRATAALRTLGECALPLDGIVATNAHVFRFERPLGEDSLYQQRPRPREIVRTRLRDTPVDPAVVAFEQAKEEYARRVVVTPQRVSALLERVMEGSDRVLASDIEIAGIDEFIVFQRLRETDVMFGGLLSGRYRIERLDSYAENEWLAFPDFAITRVPSGDGDD
jgi:Family of unknown function (DUF5716)